MAVTVPSVAFAAAGSTEGPVVTKPSNLAVGDLMIAQVTCGSTINITPPDGFTLITTVTHQGVKHSAYRKIATSGDVAASNFTFPLSGPTDGAAGILRIAGYNTPQPVFAFDEGTSTNSETPSYANTITPAANSLLIFLFAANQDSSDIGTYAITTSNPTWTEAWDTSATNISMSAAYATRPEATATGNSSVAITGASSSVDSSGIILGLAPDKSVAVVESATLTEGYSFLSHIPISEAIALTETVATTTARAWQNLARSITSWVNQSKS